MLGNWFVYSVYLTAVCCYYASYRFGIFLKHFVFHILNMLKSKLLPSVKSPRSKYKELT